MMENWTTLTRLKQHKSQAKRKLSQSQMNKKANATIDFGQLFRCNILIHAKLKHYCYELLIIVYESIIIHVQ